MTIHFTKDITRGILAFVLIVSILCASENTQAQDRLSLQVRPGVSFPTTDLDGTDLKIGLGFDVIVAYRFLPYVSVYAGWGWNKFSSDDESFAGADVDFIESGYFAGLQYMHPFVEKSRTNYFLKAGAIYNHIEVENGDEDIISDSDHGFGYQAEVGVSFGVGKNWRIAPGIKYQSLTRDLEVGQASNSVDLNYLSAGLNIARSF